MKSYTDIEQSKVLSKILPIESADMMWKKELKYRICSNEYKVSESDFMYYPTFKEEQIIIPNFDVPAWSIAALLNVLKDEIDGEDGETYQLNIEKNGTWWNVWYREQYDEADPIETESTENLVDACVAMIEKLYELKML